MVLDNRIYVYVFLIIFGWKIHRETLSGKIDSLGQILEFDADCQYKHKNNPNLNRRSNKKYTAYDHSERLIYKRKQLKAISFCCNFT